MVKPSARTNRSGRIAAADDKFLPGGGEMGERIRAFDWSRTSIGPLLSWPQSLRTAVNIVLQSPLPMVMLWGDDGIMIYNDGYSGFAGGRHPALLGSKVLEGWPEVADFNAHVMEACYRGGKTLSYKDQELILYRNGSAEQLWCDLNYGPIIAEDGTPGGVLAIVVETTQRITAEKNQQEAERALTIERERLQSLFVQAPALIAVLHGKDHVFEMANPPYIATVAAHRNIIGKPLMEAIPELAGQGVLELIDEVRRTGKPYQGIVPVKLDRGGTGQLEDGYFNLVYQPLNGSADADADSILVHAVEVTDHVMSRKRAEELNAQLEAVFDSLPDGLLITDKTHITRVNQRGAEVLGFKRPQDVPTSLEVIYKQLAINHIKDGQTVRLEDSALGNAMKGVATQHVGVRVTNGLSGQEHVLRTAAAPVRNASGEIIGAVAINNDLTEQYALQEKVHKETLRRRLLTQKTKLLKQQNRQLTQLNATKDEFIALTSHQLRTPATGVKQYIAMLLQGYAGTISEEQQLFLDKAYESNERQLQIIEDILRVAKVDMGKTQVRMQKTDIGKLLGNILEEQADRFAARKQHLAIDIPDKPIESLADPAQLHMAIGNVIDNAIKYTPDGKTITVKLQPGSEGMLGIDISDQGVGIAQPDIDKLFQKFSRIPNARSIEVGGTGLGLYWTRRIIELHKGTIAVQSQPEKGTCFTIRLPAC